MVRMLEWFKMRIFRYKKRNCIYYSKYLDHDIRIVRIYNWNDWVWEIDKSFSNHRFGTSDYDVREFVRDCELEGGLYGR